MLNKIIIVGRLTSDPTFKQVGTKEDPREIGFFSLAINQGTNDYVEFVDVSVDTFLIKPTKEYLQKGDKIAVVGRFSNRSYVTKDGTKRTSATIYAESFEFVDVYALKSAEKSDQENELPFDEEDTKPQVKVEEPKESTPAKPKRPSK